MGSLLSTNVNNRLAEELRILKADPHVQTYFRLKSYDGKSCIYGYLLPQTPPYNERAFEVRIVLPPWFPHQPCDLHLLTNIYHPAIWKDGCEWTFCKPCCSVREWRQFQHISELIEHYVDIIDGRGNIYKSCTYNSEARELCDRNQIQYDEKVQQMVRDHGCPRPT